MSDESERAARADRAREIVDNPVFQEAISRLESEYTRLSIEGETLEVREESRKYVKLVKALPGHFKAMVLDGAVAKEKLKNWN